MTKSGYFIPFKHFRQLETRGKVLILFLCSLVYVSGHPKYVAFASSLQNPLERFNDSFNDS